MMTGGAGVVIWAIMGVMMLGMITGGHQEGPQPHRAATTPTPAPPASRPRAAEPAAPADQYGDDRSPHWHPAQSLALIPGRIGPGPQGGADPVQVQALL